MIRLIIILGITAPIGMACGFMFFIHPALGIAIVIIFYIGFSYCDAALERRKKKGIEVRTEQLLGSLAEIPLGEDWRPQCWRAFKNTQWCALNDYSGTAAA